MNTMKSIANRVYALMFRKHVHNAFSEYCLCGDLTSAKRHLSMYPMLNVYNDEIFTRACMNGHLELAKWLLTVNPHTNISIYEEEAFGVACQYGHLEVAKWLLLVKPDINVSACDEYAFRCACENGHLVVAKWLLSIKPNIDISACDERAFRWACQRGHLEVAQWLISVKPSLNVSANEDCAFRWVCDKEYSDLKMALWLQSLKPEKYHLTIENGKITHWEVRVFLAICPQSISLQEVEEFNRVCLICQEHPVELQTNCLHHFCKDCIQMWHNNYSTTCPYCRSNILECVQVISSSATSSTLL